MTLKEILNVVWQKEEVVISRRSVGGNVSGPVWFLEKALTEEFLNSEVENVYKDQITLKDFSFRDEN